jgi:hypothetical protein
MLSLSLALLGFGRNASAAEATLSNGGATMEVLGIGNAALLGGDLTDPEDDGNEAAGDTDPSWNWKAIFANSEPGFNGVALPGTPAGTERSYNVFDNAADGGGDAKWCCGEPLTGSTISASNPLNITVQLKERHRLTHFTVTSANDTPTRDPRDWQILGSNDGTVWEPIFTQIGGAIAGQTTTTNTTLSLWGNTRNQVNKFTLTKPSRAYTFIRFQCSATYVTAATGAFFQLTEIEYFGLAGGALTEEAVGTAPTALIKGDVTDPDNNGSKSGGASDPSWNWSSISANNKPAFGADGAFNVFDNAVGDGNIWCCDDATAANPLNVTTEFRSGLLLTHFTVTSAGDVTGAPTKFQILGSNDGTSFTPIYTRDSATPLWTAANQVVRIDLQDAAPAYKFLRYQATETPGATHQIAEIEYFGKFGGLDNPTIADARVAPYFVQVRVTDGADTRLDPSTVQLLINNTAAAVTVAKDGAVTTLQHSRSPLFASGSSHTWRLTALDNAGNFLTRSGTFVVGTYTTIPGGYALASADESQPGFKIKVHQMEYRRNPASAPIPNIERQLAGGYNDPATGLPVFNLADLSAADSEGFLIEPATINYNEAAPAAGGSFSVNSVPPDEDRLVPGIVAGTTDHYVQSVEAILELKAGFYRFGVNSDDGFRLSFGWGAGDVIGTQVGTAGERGFTDSLVDVVAPVDGFYPVRLMWFETSGGSGAEFFSQDVLTGERFLVNDLSRAGAIKAYRSSTVSRPYVSRVLPAVGYGYTFADEDVVVEITDGALPVEASSIRMLHNNAAVALTPAKSGKVTTIRRPGGLGNLLASGANNISVIFGYNVAGTLTLTTNNYSFTVPAYTRPIPPANRVLASQVSGSGFTARGHQIDRSKDANQGNGGRNTGGNMPGPEMQLAGGYVDPTSGVPYPNLLDMSAANPDQTFTVPEVLNFNHNTTAGSGGVPANAGIFNADTGVPGLPGTGSSNQGLDNSVHEFITYMDLKAGVHIFGVNVDDGWMCSSAPNAQDTLGTLLGFRNAPGGQNGNPINNPNGAFSVIVTEPGIYPIRLLFWQGGGGVNIEFLAVDRNTGTQLLVNDVNGTYPSVVAASGLLASPYQTYSTYTGPQKPWVKSSVHPLPYIGVTSPLVNGGAAVTLWQNRIQQTAPGPIIAKLPFINNSWNPGELQNANTAQRPFGDAVGGVVSGLGSEPVGLILNGQVVTPTVTDVPGSSDKLVVYYPPTPLSASAVHTAGLIYAGTTNYWLFNVISQINLDPTNALPSSVADSSARGFRARIVQSTTARSGGNTAAAAETHLQGTPANVAVAGPEPDGSYVLPGVINLSSRRVPGQTGNEIGNFQTLLGGPADEAIPGLPGTGLSGTAGRDNFTAEIFAWLDLPAGYQRFGINGDDGWKVQVGTPGQTNGPVLFTIDRGAGSSDIPFAFTTPQAGLYPVRIVWYQGGGDGNLEFFTYGGNGEKILVNSANPKAVKAYRRIIFAEPTVSVKTLADQSIELTYTGTLQSTDSLNPASWSAVPGATSPFKPDGSSAQRFYRAVAP